MGGKLGWWRIPPIGKAELLPGSQPILSDQNHPFGCLTSEFKRRFSSRLHPGLSRWLIAITGSRFCSTGCQSRDCHLCKSSSALLTAGSRNLDIVSRSTKAGEHNLRSNIPHRRLSTRLRLTKLPYCRFCNEWV
jgi:hypothetical protein